MATIKDFEVYDADKACFAYSVTSINFFRVFVDFHHVHGLLEGESLRRVMDRLYGDAVNLVTRAEFFSPHGIKQSKESDHITLQYDDDIFSFKLSLYEGRLVLEKTGGKMSSFFRWYKAAMYELSSIVKSLMDLFKDISGRPIAPTRTRYSFRFIFYDMRTKDTHEVAKNSYIMKRLITRVPSPNGQIADVALAQTEVSRMDYAVSAWSGTGDDRRLFQYMVEAPANNEYGSLWLSFAYGSETYSDPATGSRSTVEPMRLLDEYEKVFSFMWKQGLVGFAQSLLQNVEFQTTAGYVP